MELYNGEVRISLQVGARFTDNFDNHVKLHIHYFNCI